MNRNVLSIVSVIIGTVSVSAYAYIPVHLEQFNKTNQCEGCDLSSASFSTRGDRQSPTNNHSGARLDRANLSNIRSDYLNLSGASLRQANLSGANLDDANLSYADLTGANLSGAFIQFANLYGAVGADLSNARVCDTTMPDGSASKPCGTK